MNKNLGTADRIIRLIIAAIVAILFASNIITGTLGIILMIASGIFALTSIISFCPIYFILKLRTNKTTK